ncbi:hypothetical protein BKA70DRAFT_1116552 [Coprinopsis sp. MPI-PUGE-AT-0042]|nr:hypothetical protein BKA70DRAFT_1116552 [Coprinopsis sp. MPI-PUGE-AT-0042]
MASRSFTVFQDAPGETRLRHRFADRPVLGTRSGSQVNVIAASESKGLVIDKENYNPLTGERSSLAPGAEKKRKTAVLATKVVPAKPGKKALKDKATEPQPEPKKRKTVATAKKPKSIVDKKEGKPSKTTATRKPKRSTPSRRVSPLPRVEEEETGVVSTAVVVNSRGQSPGQAIIDSRCYELTVQPLADVSGAYEVPSSTLELVTNSPKLKGPLRMIKERSVEPELRDYCFSPSDSLFGKASSSLFGSHSREISQQTLFNDDDGATQSTATTFSTPERQKIYSAFTFCSPSPSSKRFREFGTRSVSPTPFIIDVSSMIPPADQALASSSRVASASS